MPSADQVPVKSPHSTMHWHMWVVLIAGSTGSALRAVRPPNLHITPDLLPGLAVAISCTTGIYTFLFSGLSRRDGTSASCLGAQVLAYESRPRGLYCRRSCAGNTASWLRSSQSSRSCH